ncbi:MAG: hypothetical protein FJ146_09280 [Deltaproteobacteria bacterium]|nr:hypothetical protein [Deltaproteobacteria bacterium]
MNRCILSLAILLWSGSGYSSTFIGNGGNMLDPSLRLTLSRIAAAIAHAKEYPDDVCTCRGTSEQCAFISESSEIQAHFCAKFIADHAAEFLELVKPNGGISFVWSDKTMTDHKEHRSSDAIAQREKKRVILNELRFRDLSDAGRVQLVAHELGHFLSHDGQEIGDRGALGPYKGADGSRTFLDTIGAAIAIEARRAEVLTLDDDGFSAPFYKWRISYFSESYNLDPTFTKASFVPSSGAREALALSYYRRATSNIGFAYRYTSTELRGSNERRTGVNGELRLVTNYLGLEWRGILLSGASGPWASYLHYAVFIGGGVGSVSQRIYDSFNSETQSKNLVGAKTDVNLYLPLYYGFLASLGMGYDYAPYKLEQLSVTQKDATFSFSVGVSYGI